ncbi:glycosyltransferase WbuB [Cryobacterium cryoconiti]|uniref:D-inositol 3-phosphate glycosyltransferase n=1 Tax=Cryobacterium cryoconiti TaxID=1259239 RepID=A0A4Y8JUJ7_9MICO|nr:glycosyltransferase WbuB [Cryobacterium cryoconiti]
MRPLKILIVSQYYPPEFAIIPSELAEILAARGHSVRVLTGFPNYPQGRLYAGFKQSWRHIEFQGDVAVRRVPMFIDHSQNGLARVGNYLSFAFGTVMATRFARGADVVYVYATQMTAAAAPQLWRSFLGIPYVLHVQDLWPESVTGSSIVRSGLIENLVNRLLGPWLSSVYRLSAAVIAIAPTMHGMLADRGVPEKKLHTVLNWAADSADVVRGPIETEYADGLCVVYAGNIGELQDLDTALEAARLVQDLEGFRLIVVGTGVAEERLRKSASDARIRNVEFRGRIDPADMDAVYEESDFQLVTLRDLPIFRGTIPSKLQGSLAKGVPIITNVAGDVTRIVSEEGVGLTVPPENPHALAEAFREAHSMSVEVRRDLGRRGRELYLRSMSARAGVDAIEAVLKAATIEEDKRGNRCNEE